MLCTTYELMAFLSAAFPKIDVGPNGFVGTGDHLAKFCSDPSRVEKYARAIWDAKYAYQKDSRAAAEVLKDASKKHDEAVAALYHAARAETF